MLTNQYLCTFHSGRPTVLALGTAARVRGQGMLASEAGTITRCDSVAGSVLLWGQA